MAKKTILLMMVVVIFKGSYAYAASNKNAIAWQNDLEAANITAKKTRQMIIMDFYADWCPPCKKMESETYNNPRVIQQLKNYIPVKIDIDKNQDIAKKYDGNPLAYGGNGIPTTIIMDAGGNQYAKVHGFLTPEQMLKLLKNVEEKLPKQ